MVGLNYDSAIKNVATVCLKCRGCIQLRSWSVLWFILTGLMYAHYNIVWHNVILLINCSIHFRLKQHMRGENNDIVYGSLDTLRWKYGAIFPTKELWCKPNSMGAQGPYIYCRRCTVYCKQYQRVRNMVCKSQKKCVIDKTARWSKEWQRCSCIISLIDVTYYIALCDS